MHAKYVFAYTKLEGNPAHSDGCCPSGRLGFALVSRCFISLHIQSARTHLGCQEKKRVRRKNFFPLRSRLLKLVLIDGVKSA
jgi:hypothetical protein